MSDLDGEEFRRWRRSAARTLDAARLTGGGERAEWACFLAEQAAQLSVKGLLHGIGEPAWGHDLVVLMASAHEKLAEVLPDATDEGVARLSRHYIAARYPDAHPSGPPDAHYTSGDAAQALTDAEAVVAAVDVAWEQLSTAPS